MLRLMTCAEDRRADMTNAIRSTNVDSSCVVILAVVEDGDTNGTSNLDCTATHRPSLFKRTSSVRSLKRSEASGRLRKSTTSSDKWRCEVPANVEREASQRVPAKRSHS